jgi:uncharacterized protein DUF6522
MRRSTEIAEWQQLYDETKLLGQRESALMTDTAANKIDTGIHWTEGAVEVDATLVARGLNLPVEQFMAEMRRGIVHSTSERGIGEDAESW